MKDVLKIDGLSSAITAGSTFTFQTTGSSFKNPPSTKAVSTFEAASYSSSSKGIDAQTSGISYQVSTAATLAASQVSINTVNSSINEPEQFNFSILMDLPLPVGAVFEITIPTEVSMYADDGTLLLTGAAGGGSLFASATVQIMDITTQRVEVTNLVPSYVNQVDPNNPITFGLLQLKNPGSIQTTPEFAIAVYQEEDIILNVD